VDVTDFPWRDVSRLLVVRLDNAGDVIMCEPALRAIRLACPNSHVTLWASPGGAAVSALLSEVDDTLITRAIWQDLGHLSFDPERERDLIQTLAEGAFDATIIFTSFSQSPLPPAYACYLAGIAWRAGQSRDFGGALLSHAVDPPSDSIHQVDRNLHLVRHLGFVESSTRMSVSIPPAARESLGLKLRIKGIGLGRPFVAMHAGASCASRRYPAERFVEVGKLLCRTLGWPLVLTGSATEAALIDSLALGIGPCATAMAGQTTLPELAALIERATAVITNNTLTMHLADALGTPGVVLFSGTEREEQWRPRKTALRLLRRPTACSPCYRFECPYNLECLDLSPRQVASAVLQLVGEVAA
jgi:ADP-heptose:LPS heptosyltransferase